MDVDGFLSEDTQKGRDVVREAYSDWFRLGKELNRFGMEVLQRIEVDRSMKYETIEAVLFLRSLEIFQSVLSMLEVQNASAVKILTRSMLEDIFVLVALQRDPELMESYLATDRKVRVGILKGFRRMAGELSNHDLDVREIDREISGLQNVKSRAGTLQPYEWAEKAGMSGHYRMYYTRYSASVHSNPLGLNDHFDMVDGVPKIAFGPQGKDGCEIFDVASLSMVKAISAMMFVFRLDGFGDLQAYQDRVKVLEGMWLNAAESQSEF